MTERFAGLHERLMADGRDDVVLDFGDFDVFLLGGLPLTAQRDPSWWANSDGDPAHAHVHAWLDAGYVVADLDLDGGKVRFRRRERRDA
jgi:hypothetical protein